MIWFVILGTLAAFGALCILWILIGALLCSPGCAVVCLSRQEDAVLVRRRCRWLRELGFVRNPVVVVCALSTAQEMIEQEWNALVTAGNGDPPGNHRCGGVSEL